MLDGGLSVRVRWMLLLGACALVAGLYVATARRGRAPAVAPSTAVAASSSSAAGERRRPPPEPPPRWPFEDKGATPSVVPFQSPEAEEERRIRSLPPELRRAERSKRASEPTGRRSPYPADCKPASEALHKLLPHYVAPVVRPLGPTPMELGHALVRAVQDRDHLLPGDTALLTLEVAVDGLRAPFEVKSAELLQPSATPGGRAESLASVAFRDDGVLPDRAAQDGVATAGVSVPARLRNFDGDLRVRADVTTGNETGEVVFPLVATSASPASFTGTVREGVENGSLAFYAGIRAKKTGRYHFVGRVYDSGGRIMAVLTADTTLNPSAREIRLSLCGKLLRDEAIAGPWELRDVEGFHFVEVDGRLTRIAMATWSGPHRTRTYPLDTFSEGAPDESEPPAR